MLFSVYFYVRVTYTFYNGTEKWEKELQLKLSDSYQIQDGEPMLELTVRVININPGERHEVLEKCQTLKEYSLFVEKVRQLQIQGDPDPYRHAVEACIRDGILSDYLRKKGSEVINMLVAEYDYDLDIQVQREEAYEEGQKAGRREGYKQGEHALLKSLIQLNLSNGRTVEEIAAILGRPAEQIAALAMECEEP